MSRKLKLYGTSEAALELGCAVEDLRELIASGELPAVKVDGRFVLDERAVDIARDLLDQEVDDGDGDPSDVTVQPGSAGAEMSAGGGVPRSGALATATRYSRTPRPCCRRVAVTVRMRSTKRHPISL